MQKVENAFKLSTPDINKQETLVEDIANVQTYEKIISEVLKANYVDDY
jgi:hypothetical protein